jgi:hypothetical protein
VKFYFDEAGLGGNVRIRALAIAPCCCAVLVIAQVAQVAQAQGQAQNPQNLADVKTLFVDSLGQGEFPNVIRDKIIKGLTATGRFEVTLDPREADATLKGSATESQPIHYGNGNGSRYESNVAVQLVGKDQQILWTFEATKGRFSSKSATSSAAETIVKELLKAARPHKAKSK